MSGCCCLFLCFLSSLPIASSRWLFLPTLFLCTNLEKAVEGVFSFLYLYIAGPCLGYRSVRGGGSGDDEWEMQHLSANLAFFAFTRNIVENQ